MSGQPGKPKPPGNPPEPREPQRPPPVEEPPSPSPIPSPAGGQASASYAGITGGSRLSWAVAVLGGSRGPSQRHTVPSVMGV